MARSCDGVLSVSIGQVFHLPGLAEPFSRILVIADGGKVNADRRATVIAEAFVAMWAHMAPNHLLAQAAINATLDCINK